MASTKAGQGARAAQRTYDYIVVGAGSAGAVVAARLSEDAGTSVLLVEAGGSHKHLSVQVPAAFSKQFKTERDWNVLTEPEPHLGGRRIYHPRAKMLGGCSGMNAMIYIRGNKADYDGWAKSGATGWSYDEVLPYFKRSENNSRGADRFHGDQGPQHIQDLRSPNPVVQRLIEGAAATGLQRNDDFNGAAQEGTGFYQVTHKRGSRWTTADGYLAPAAKRANLTVLTEAHVHRVTLSEGRATGIEVEVDGEMHAVRCTREVVLSAGAFNTPQLLMLSGIGPAEHLAEHGIEAVVDNPHVGDHLMDHPMYLVNAETSASGTLAEAESPKQLVNYLARRRGVLTSNVGEGGAFFHTRAGLDAPDMQLIFAPGYFWEHGAATHDTPAMGIGCSLVGAKSRGQVRLRSADPKDQVAATFNYFAEQEDMDAMVAAVEKVREILASSPMRELVGEEIHPGSQTRTREELEEEIRRGVEHTYHPSCTARIGSEGEGVVDPELRVYGVTGLRVADASVFPTVTHGNTHAPTVLVGEKAADLIRAAQ
ncbi:GMC family oxidoreductase [Nocardioides insulae]|uniref:GMC family oxidoreductase n=1 Tax=Nocardioides insulae TaxID=394734 RepID=UPI000407C00A|nr:GMC family oxidoreductase N-terminal domain-containing protein [Nocardioides insulae]